MLKKPISKLVPWNRFQDETSWPLTWLDVFTAALEEQNSTAEGQTTPSERLRTASLAIARHIDSDPEPPRRAFVVAATHPELLRGFHAAYQRWVDAITIESEAAGLDPFEARIIASSVVGMVDATTRAWLMGEEPSFEDALSRGLSYTAGLLDRLDTAGLAP